ncbi:hypothetical protein [Pseudoalteromonas aurantia]|jgi:proline dehydrogenase|uniref:Uncharacterized protein n=1 Tax=Pseudoalteromonas aurantia TaxID=43654 RepID=A0A5S3VEE7_9GAMM|nr:hypothetical protein [Pseudoalteromonas aurantia]TMO65213.1 hypothetical protein CWC18_05350 [Pseudoalteromonas aurantia]TMO70521.1 hypothetical protein CWC19_01505 [Pseudoalteromonas aurantia]TMO77613.1 hypothetical protein CWC20_03225 [Pseudoalteromonas aurantia]
MTIFTKITITTLFLGASISAQANTLTSELYNEVSSQINSIISTQIEEVKSATVRSMIAKLHEESEKQNTHTSNTTTSTGDNDDK